VVVTEEHPEGLLYQEEFVSADEERALDDKRPTRQQHHDYRHDPRRAAGDLPLGRVGDGARCEAMSTPAGEAAQERLVEVPIRDLRLEGALTVPPAARGIVVFAHGSGSGRFSPRNRAVAGVLVDAGLATLLMDLLTAEEEAEDIKTRRLRFDIRLLAERVVGAIDWLSSEATLAELTVGCFGASTGAAAALIAAAERPQRVAAVVSRGGRPDLAGDALPLVRAPTLLIVGGRDTEVIELNRRAQVLLGGESRLEIVPGATHLFEEPRALEQVAALARDWFLRYLATGR
jgi:putative phosphoribosyl transferase